MNNYNYLTDSIYLHRLLSYHYYPDLVDSILAITTTIPTMLLVATILTITTTILLVITTIEQLAITTAVLLVVITTTRMLMN